MFNPMQIMGAAIGGGNPLSLMLNQLNSNPLFRQAQQMARGKSESEMKQTCENICRQKGINLNDAWAQFQSQFPGLR